MWFAEALESGGVSFFVLHPGPFCLYKGSQFLLCPSGMAVAPRTTDEGERTSSVHVGRAEHLCCDALCRSKSGILP